MLHSNLAMKSVKLISLLLIPLLIFSINVHVQAQEDIEPTVEIIFPLPGEAAQGLLQIIGTIEIEELDYYSLEFAFQESTSDAWFNISRGDATIIEDTLGEWDTSSIPDGKYNLRLTVYSKSLTPVILVVEGIRVRNYSPIETNTPAPTSDLPTLTPTIEEAILETPTSDVFPPTQTPPNPNPASVSQQDILENLFRGAIGGIVLFIIFLLYRAAKIR